MKEKTKVSFAHIFPILIKTGLLLLSLLGAVKMIFFGLEVDEEYAVVMSYRMVLGDRMLLDMWEPHQTSGFVCALFIQLFLWIFGSTDYLIIGLRIFGVTLQLLVSLFLYTTLKKYTTKDAAFWAAVMCFSLLPKWIQIPEFSNILLWSSLCTMMCLLRFAKAEKHRYFWLIVAAIFYCMSVLAYPTCLLVVPVYLYGIARSMPQKAKRHIAVFFGTCAVIGIGYLFYLLPPRSLLEQFGIGIREMTTDGYHEAGLIQKIINYVQEFVTLLPDILLVLVVTGVIFLLVCKTIKVEKLNKRLAFILLLILVSHVHQLIVWSGDHLFMNEPLIFFYVAFLPGIFYGKQNRELVRFCIWPTIAIMISVLLITNTTISVTGANLLPGILAGGILLWEYVREKELSKIYHYLTIGTGIVMIGLLLFAKGYLVCENEGLQADIFYVKQKALSGPAKGIYCRYVDGYSYNALADLTAQYVEEEDVVLYAGNHNLRYMLFLGRISTPSTISTPTYDEKLLRYWDLYPYRYPTIVIEETGAGYLDEIEKLLPLSELIAESEDIRIYRVKQ